MMHSSIHYHSIDQMQRQQPEPTRPDAPLIERLAQRTADVTAATVNGLQDLGVRRRRLSARRVAVGIIGGATRVVVRTVAPQRSPPEKLAPSAKMSLVQ